MFVSSFIFDKKEYDDQFYVLDAQIEHFTRQIPGFIGMESYCDSATGRLINHYYWQDRASMEQLIQHSDHLKAKASGDRWLAAWQVIIAQIEGAWNVNLPHPLADHNLRYTAGQ